MFELRNIKKRKEVDLDVVAINKNPFELGLELKKPELKRYLEIVKKRNEKFKMRLYILRPERNWKPEKKDSHPDKAFVVSEVHIDWILKKWACEFNEKQYSQPCPFDELNTFAMVFPAELPIGKNITINSKGEVTIL